MLKSFETRGMGAGSFFKILYVGNFVWCLIFAIIVGIIALVSPQSATGAEAHALSFMSGFLGFIILVVISPLYALLLTIGQWIFIGFGLWLWTRFRTLNISLSVVDSAPTHEAPSMSSSMHDE